VLRNTVCLFDGLTGELDVDNEQINDHWPLNTTVKDNGGMGFRLLRDGQRESITM